MASPNVYENHGAFGDEIFLVRIVFYGGMGHPYKDMASISEYQRLRYHSPSGPTTAQRIVSLITASRYGRRQQLSTVGKIPSPSVRESSSRAFLYTSGNTVIARKKEARTEDD